MFLKVVKFGGKEVVDVDGMESIRGSVGKKEA